MTLTVEVSPETLTRLQQEAAQRGQEPSVLVAQALETLFGEPEEHTDAVFVDMRAMSLKTLREYWDNDEDAVYDTL